MKNLFEELFHAPTEDAVNNIIQSYSIFHDPSNWRPYGNTQSNFSVVENQQSNSVASLVEKLTNSIDALLMKKCYEAGIEPQSHDAPKTMDEDVHKFYGGVVPELASRAHQHNGWPYRQRTRRHPAW